MMNNRFNNEYIIKNSIYPVESSKNSNNPNNSIANGNKPLILYPEDYSKKNTSTDQEEILIKTRSTGSEIKDVKKVSLIVNSNTYYTKELLEIMAEDIFESGITPRSEKFIRDEVIPEIGMLNTMLWLSSVFLSYNGGSDTSIGILHIISHFEYNEISPIGQLIATAGFSNKNIEVKDFAIKAFENWNSKESIDILENNETTAKWLDEYIEEVIINLKKYGE